MKAQGVVMPIVLRCLFRVSLDTYLVKTSAGLSVPGTFRIISRPCRTRCCMNRYRSSMCRDFRLAPNRTAKLLPKELSVPTRTLSFFTNLLSKRRFRMAKPSNTRCRWRRVQPRRWTSQESAVFGIRRQSDTQGNDQKTTRASSSLRTSGPIRVNEHVEVHGDGLGVGAHSDVGLDDEAVVGGGLHVLEEGLQLDQILLQR